MINSSIIITEYKNSIISWLDTNSKMEAISITNELADIVGNIYVGKIKQVVSNLQACFVEFLPGKLGFLSFFDAPNIKLIEGNDVVVQIVKEASKNKDAVLTTNLSIAGKYTIIENKPGISVSRKIEGERRARLKELVKNVSDKGIIVRTNASLVEDTLIINEIEKLDTLLSDIITKSNTRTCSTLLYKADSEYLRFIKGLPTNSYERIVTDLPYIYEALSNEYSCELYNDDYPLGKLYSLQTKIDELLSKQIWLKCGGNIVIEPTEALTVIDVNTAKNMSKKDREENSLRVNLEAAHEIARQCRLRNLSGIIIVDFINMSQENEKKLIDEFKNELKKDMVRCDFVEMTSLGLAQIVRKKIKPPIYEKLQ